MSNLINIYSLRKKKSERELRRLEIYKTVLERCHRRIKMRAESFGNEVSVFFTIPKMIVGMPSYDMVSCADYLVNNLAMNGFKVVQCSPEQLFISWGHIKFDAAKETALENKIQELRDIENGVYQPRLADQSKTMPDEPQETFRPVYDTPSTEKYLMT